MSVTTRRNKVFELLNDDSLAVFFAGTERHLSQDAIYPFEVNRNFYYLTGINVEKQILMLHKGVENTAYLFVEENTPLKAKWDGERMSKKEASSISGIPEANILYLEQFEKMVQLLMGVSRKSSQPAEYMYLDLLRIREFEAIEAHNYARKVKDLYPQLQVRNVEPEMARLRMIKDELEIQNIKEAIAITKTSLEHMQKQSKVGHFEYQMESFFKQQLYFHHSKEAFVTICASGKNATVLHYVQNDTEAKDGTLVLTDLGASYSVYNADITRTWPVNGTFTDRQKEIYEIVLKANKETIALIKPGVTWKELNEFAYNTLFEGMKKLGFVEEPADLAKYYYHSIGHHLGLDVHDVGVYTESLQEGMVITIEPGLYIAEEEIGIRLEDDILVTKDGHLNLSQDIPIEIADVEQLMQ